MTGADDTADHLRSLAVGAVVRGRATPAEAASWSPMTVEELERYRSVAGPDGPPAERPRLSVVVPCYQEAETLALLWEALRPVLDDGPAAEVVLVDDGSTDGTWGAIERLAGADGRIRGVRLSRNFGHQAALSAGLREANGDCVVCMDADLQDPPELIPELVRRWEAGSEVVFAVRRTREGSRRKRAAYRIFYRLYRRLADIDVPLDSGDFALLDRRVVDEIVALPERNRFLRGLRSWVGFRHEAVAYDRPERAAGETKYSFTRLVRLAIDGLVAFSSTPLRAASIIGFLTALAGVLYVLVAVFARLFLGGVPRGWTSLIALLLTLGGVQLLVIGVVGEYVGRIYDEAKRRPHFVVRDRAGR